MEIVFLVVGVVIGGIVTYFVLNARQKDAAAKLMLTTQQLAQEQSANRQLRADMDGAVAEKRDLQEQLTQLKIDLERANTQLQAEQEHNSKEAEMRKEQFEQQLKTVQEQFSNLATRVLDQTADKLKHSNSESMESITRPLKQNIEQLHQVIQTTNSETTKHTASLSQQLKEMAEQTQKIDATATRLTNVIRGGNKAQGNWGERRLAELLESQGLLQGIDYDMQQTITDDKGNAVLNDESGRRMIPDVILHYPNNEDVIVDSKVSIDAYYNYVNTEDEGLKRKYAEDLVRSIRTQAFGLAKKDYSKYVQKPRKAIDFVIMYVPFEGALQLALATEPKIWGEAFDRQVLITSQQNLIAILKMIQIAWRQYAQTENQKKVFGMAEELLKRVGDFIKRFDKVKKDIENLHRDYDDAYSKAYTGRQSIVQKANELKQLGVKESANQPIPDTEPNLLEDEED